MALKLSTYTMYDTDCLEELQWVVSKTIDPSVARKERLVGLVWCVCAFVASFIALRKNGHPALVAFFFVVGLFFGARVLNVYRSMGKKSWMDMDKSVVRNDYLLDKSHIVATNAKGSARYPYSQCFRLLETDERCYVILKDGQGIVLDKAHVSSGDGADLVSLLESRCGKKAEKLSYRHLPRPDFHFDFKLPGSGPRRLK